MHSSPVLRMHKFVPKGSSDIYYRKCYLLVYATRADKGGVELLGVLQ